MARVIVEYREGEWQVTEFHDWVSVLPKRSQIPEKRIRFADGSTRTTMGFQVASVEDGERLVALKTKIELLEREAKALIQDKPFPTEAFRSNYPGHLAEGKSWRERLEMQRRNEPEILTPV